jgi:hypothetical protein
VKASRRRKGPAPLEARKKVRAEIKTARGSLEKDGAISSSKRSFM